MRSAATLATLALLILPLLAPVTNATPPVPNTASYDALTPIVQLGLSADGSTAAAALKAAVNAPTPGTLPGTPSSSVATSDLAILDATNGFATNGSGSTGSLGRSHVALSSDGRAIASLGLNATTSNVGGIIPGLGGGGAQASQWQVYYQKLNTGTTRWAPNAAAANTSRVITGNATALLLSSDGSRVVVGANVGSSFTVQGFVFDGALLQQQFSFTQSGTLFHLAGTQDVETIAVATQITESGNKTHGALWSLSFSTGRIVSTLYDRSVNGTAFVSTAITPDGRLLVGDQRGRVLYANHVNDLTPLQLPGATTNVTPFAMSADGKRLAVGTSNGIYMLNTTSAPALIWNRTIAGQITAIQANATGGMIIVGVNGTDGGVYGFGDVDSIEQWKINGNAQGASINAAGTMVTYAQNNAITNARVPRSIAFELPGGSKTADSRPVKPLGSAIFEVNVRNSGAALERVTFTGPREADVRVVADPPLATVRAGSTANVTLTLTVGPSFTGRHAFNVTAHSLSSGLVDNITLSLNIQTATDVSLETAIREITAIAGVRTDLTIGVINNGSRDVALGMHAVQAPSSGGEWNVTIDPSTFTLAPTTRTTVRISVTPPAGTPNGTADNITFIMQGPEVSDQVSITFRIDPTLGIDVTAAGRVKFVEPGKVASYNVTVTNSGSLPRTFQAYYEMLPNDGKNWGVDMDTNTFRLNALSSRVIPVKIIAPSDAVPNDRVGVLVIARTVPELATENVTTANVTLFATAIALQITTTTPTTNLLPATGAFGAIAVLAIASFALSLTRRRFP